MFLKPRLLTLLLWIANLNHDSVQSAGSWNLKDMQFENITHMDVRSRKAMERMHDDLDKDDDGNVSISEGVKFIAGNQDLLKSTGEGRNLPGFVNDTDGRITEAEFWDSWINSDVHNWTNSEMLSWLKYDVEMPQYAARFRELNISGAAFPILACESAVVSALVEGSKENKLKLMLKAKEIVLFGPSKPKSNWMKDALLTFSLALALSGIAFGVHVQRTANRTILTIQEKMKSLQKSVDKMEEEDEIEWPTHGPRPDDDGSAGSNSAESLDSMITSYSVNGDDVAVQGKLADVMKELDATKEALRNAEKKLQKMTSSFELPQELLNWLRVTYQEETKLFEMKKKQVYDNVDHTKTQFQKIERNRSTFLGILQVVHSRQVDNFDSEVQQTREQFRELQSIMKERRKRWAYLDQICKCKVLPTSTRVVPPVRMPSVKSITQDVFETAPEFVSDQNSLLKKKQSKGRKSPMSVKGSENSTESSTPRVSSKKSKSSPSPRTTTVIPTHSSSPALSLTLNGHGYSRQGDNGKMIHSESANQLSHLNNNSLLSIPESGNQTFPKRSPSPRRRGKISDVVEMDNGQPGEQSPTSDKRKPVSPRKKKSEPADALPLNPVKRSGSSQSLPQLQDSESITDMVLKRSSLVSSPTDSEDSSQSVSLSPVSLEGTRKSNLKKRSFFTFIRKKK